MTAEAVARGRLDREDPIPDIDLADPDPATSVRRDEVLAELRPTHPVFWHAPKSRPGFWAVIRYAETLEVYRDSATFSAAHGMTIDSLQPDGDAASGMMVEVTDPPEHRRLRRAVGGLFADGVVGDLTPAIDQYVRGLVDGVLRRSGPVDFASEVAPRIPTYAAGLLLGLPETDLEWITDRTAVVFLAGVGDDGSDLRKEAEQANSELLSYFARLLRKSHHAEPGGGLVRRLSEGTANREGLSTPEVILNSLNLAIGGTTTTRAVLTNLVHGLVEYPDRLAVLRERPESVPTAIEEAVRWANPVRHLARVATRDAELGGRWIRAGDPVLVFPRSANCDETVFPDARVFDVHRHPNPHIGFAAGPHSCPGTGLARVQLRSVLRCLVESVSYVKPAGPARLLQSNFLHGYTRLPVRLHALHQAP